MTSGPNHPAPADVTVRPASGSPLEEQQPQRVVFSVVMPAYNAEATIDTTEGWRRTMNVDGLGSGLG